jgi:hypothetical protein
VSDQTPEERADSTLKKRRKPYTRFNRSRREKFLTELRQTGNVTASCEAAFVDRHAAYSERRRNQEFAAAWEEALEIAIERMEREAHRRAVDGTVEPVFGRVDKYQDGQIGTIRRYSDTLLIFLLKAHRPDRYRERYDLHHSGSIQQTPMDLSRLSDDELEQLEQIVSKAAEPD